MEPIENSVKFLLFASSSSENAELVALTGSAAQD